MREPDSIFCGFGEKQFFQCLLVKMFEKCLFYNLFVYLCEVKQTKRLLNVGFSYIKIMLLVLGFHFEKKI